MSSLVDWENVCLVCLRKGESRFIFAEDNDLNVIANKIMKCADVFVKRDINQPQNICLRCLDDLNVAYKFRRNCEQSDSIIKAILNTNHQKFKIKDILKTTPIIVNQTHDILFKDGIVACPVVGDTCDGESTLRLNIDDRDSEVNIFEDCTGASVSDNVMEQNNAKANESNQTEQEMNYDVSKRPRGRPKKAGEVFCGEGILQSAYKRPLKICKICNRGLRGQARYTVHMRRHNNERPFSCDYCDKAFVRAAELQSHKRVHTGEKPFKCQYCDRWFSDYSVRRNHESTHTGERPYKCSTCGKNYANAKGLTEHLKTHTGVKKYVCKECGKGFMKKVVFERHRIRHLARKELNKLSEHKQKKQLENEIFQIEENVNSNEINIKHEIVDNAVVDDACESTPCLDLEYISDSEARFIGEYRADAFTTMKISKMKSSECNQTKQEVYCGSPRRPRGRPRKSTEVSSANLKSKSSLKICESMPITMNRTHDIRIKHEILESDVPDDTCYEDTPCLDFGADPEASFVGKDRADACTTLELCNMESNESSQTKQDMYCGSPRRPRGRPKKSTEVYSANLKSETTPKICESNPITMNPIHDIRIKHEILGYVNDPYDESTPSIDVKSNPDIEVKFSREDRALPHSNTIELNKVKVNPSNKTKREANSEISKRPRGRPKKSPEESLRRAKSAYRKPQKICKICNHAFRDQHGLDSHVRRHNNERPFSCDHCDKSFVTSTELLRHVREYTGQKPYKCQYCDRRFSVKGIRNNHERTHTGERPYVCPTCGKSFAYSYVLSKHRRTHTAVKKFVCNECGKAFKTRMPFEKHVADHYIRAKLDQPEPEQTTLLEKEVFQKEEFATSGEINIKDELIIEDEIS